MRDSLPNPSNEHRIKSLEKAQRADLRTLDSVVSHIDECRAAQVFSHVLKDIDTLSESLVSVVWLYPTFVSGELILTARSASAQAFAGIVEGQLPPVGMRGLCVRVNNRWLWVTGGLMVDPGSSSSSSDSNSEEPCYTLGIDWETLPVLNGGWALGFSAEGCLGKFNLGECVRSSSSEEVIP